jgi:UrcA family protein
MNRRIQSLTLLAAFSTVALVLDADVAMAATPLDPEPVQIVRVHDLILSKPADVEKLYVRISRAASSVCNAANPNPFPHTSYFLRCYRDAMDRAISQINSPELATLYRDKVSHGTSG